MMLLIPHRLRGRSLRDLWQLITLNMRHVIAKLSPAARSARAADLAFDRQWGTNTSGGESTRELGYTGELLEHSKRYDPSSEEMLRGPVDALALNPAEHDFVDYGAGKGRMLMIAMQMGFRSVTGVELSERLCRIAKGNIALFTAKNPGLRCAEVIAANALAYRPTGDSIVAYFYNPFDATVMKQVRASLEQAVDNGLKQVTIIYVNPEHDALFRDAPRWTNGPQLFGIGTFTLTR